MQYDWCPYKKRKRNIETDTDIQGEGHVKVETEIGMMHPQAKEC